MDSGILRKTAANSTLAIGGVSSLLDSFVVTESSVLRTNFCAEKPAHRKSAKRYLHSQDLMMQLDDRSKQSVCSDDEKKIVNATNEK